jgi:tRNA modification GTPase
MKERKSLVLVNKNDLEQKLNIDMIKNELPQSQVIRTSLINGEGIEEIENSIEELVYGGEIVQKESMMVNNVRHIELLKQGRDSLNDALMMAQNREALDFLEIDVKNAYDFLGEIIGETVSDDIINEVFARFCLGK